MNDYIDILIEYVCDQGFCSDPEYYSREARAHMAADALMASLDKEQKELYMACEEAQNSAESLYENALLRQVFLLAREIYR